MELNRPSLNARENLFNSKQAESTTIGFTELYLMKYFRWASNWMYTSYSMFVKLL